jgi:hypothetical protein
MYNFVTFFQECFSGLADFFKISRLMFRGLTRKISGLAISGPKKKLAMPTSAFTYFVHNNFNPST